MQINKIKIGVNETKNVHWSKAITQTPYIIMFHTSYNSMPEVELIIGSKHTPKAVTGQLTTHAVPYLIFT